MVIKIVLPENKTKEVTGCGWLNTTWWSNGGYNFQYGGRIFWHLCLEKKGEPNVGYNAIVTKIGKSFKGLIWSDAVAQGHNRDEQTNKVIKYFKVRR